MQSQGSSPRRHGHWGRVPAEIGGDRELSKGAIRTFILLASFANAEHRAWPSQGLLAELLWGSDDGRYRSRVREYLKELRDRGWIRIEQQERLADGGWTVIPKTQRAAPGKTTGRADQYVLFPFGGDTESAPPRTRRTTRTASSGGTRTASPGDAPAASRTDQRTDQRTGAGAETFPLSAGLTLDEGRRFEDLLPLVTSGLQRLGQREELAEKITRGMARAGIHAIGSLVLEMLPDFLPREEAAG